MKRVIFLWIISITLSLTGICQQIYGGGEDNPDLKTNQETLNQWQDLKFGMFIHWGPVSLRGTEIGWSRGPIIPIAEYDQLYNEFNPSLFNAEEWVKIAKEAGMKYLAIKTIGPGKIIQDKLVKRDNFYISPEDLTTRYLKISAKNPRLCPSWHKGAGKKAWIFVDEVIID